MKITIYIIDAFAKKQFTGNSAAVCPLKKWLPDSVMQSIALENNLSETAFFVPTSNGYHIRWFTPAKEVELCGHATLASAYVIFNHLNHNFNEIVFESKSGELKASQNNEWIELDFPVLIPFACETPDEFIEAFGLKPKECFKAMDYMLVFDDEEYIKRVNPNLSLLKSISGRGVIITAISKKYDFVNRFFTPKYGIGEDPVTGSAFTQLTPYWSSRLNKKKLFAKQVSKRGGEVKCEIMGDRVKISGTAVEYSIGRINI